MPYINRVKEYDGHKIKHTQGENQELLEYFHKQSELCTDRNRTWFKPLLKSYMNYTLWTTVYDNQKNIVAFSSIQEHGFPSYTARIGTRSFIDQNYRNYAGLKCTKVKTPIFKMLLSQYLYLKERGDKENCFASMELGRVAALKLSADKFNNVGIKAKVLNNRYQMFMSKNDHPSMYQNILFFPIHSYKFDLKKEP